MNTDAKGKIWFWVWRHISKAPPFLIETWQERRLRRLLAHHCQNNFFYKKILDEAGVKSDDIINFGLEDLKRLPILDKEVLNQYGLSSCAAANIDHSRFILLSTSGSTGAPFSFWLDRKYSRLSEILKSRIQSEQDAGKARTIFIQVRVADLKLSDRLYVSGLDLYDNEKNRELIKRILDFEADVIVSFPSFFCEFCELLRVSNIEFKKPLFKIAISYAESLTDEERKFIEDVLGCEVFDRYGLSETLVVGGECQKHDGFHLYSESFILEVVDDEGLPLPPESEGRVILTHFDNEILPFLRYDTGDLGTVSAKTCHCGDRAPLFRIKGRRPSPKVWKMKGGLKINSGFFYMLFLDQAENIKRYQAVKKSDDRIEIRIVPGPKFTPIFLQLLKDKIVNENKIPGLNLEFAVVDKILPLPNGKREDFIEES